MSCMHYMTKICNKKQMTKKICKKKKQSTNLQQYNADYDADDNADVNADDNAFIYKPNWHVP